ncbi:MAG: tetratricopeptide repeat protein [Cyclobacteriaceae bacterium]
MRDLSENPNASITSLLEAEKIAFEESNKEDLARCYWALGYTYQILNSVANSKKYYLGALRIYESLDDQGSQLKMLENIGTLSLDNGLAKSAAQYYNKRLSIAMASKKPLWIAEACIDMGLATRGMNALDSSLAYFNRALIAAQSKNDNQDLLARIHNQIGITTKTIGLARNQEELIDSAAIHFLISLDKAQRPINKFHANNNMGSIKTYKSEYQKALAWFKSAYNLGEALNSNRLLISVFNNLGIVHYKQKNLIEADSLFNMAITLGMQSNEASKIMADHDLILSFDDVSQGITSLRYLDSINQVLPFSQLRSAALARINSEAFERQIIVSQERARALAAELALAEDDFLPLQIKTDSRLQKWIIVALSVAGVVMALIIFILLRKKSTASRHLS